MRIPDHPTLILRMLQHRLKKLATSSPVLAASFGTYTPRCGLRPSSSVFRPFSCRCHHGGPLPTGPHLTVEEQGKTRSVYVPKELLPAVRSWLAEPKRLKALLHEIHQLAVALLRARARSLRLKAVLTQFLPYAAQGRTPALWQEYQALLPPSPENSVRREWAAGPVQELRWVNQLDYQDREGRRWKLNALECTETTADGQRRFLAWLTWLPVGRKTVEEIAQQGGRYRWQVEKEGFKRQKNSGLNLEQVYSTDPEKWKAYYVICRSLSF
jgi:hypothetical protein